MNLHLTIPQHSLQTTVQSAHHLSQIPLDCESLEEGDWLRLPVPQPLSIWHKAQTIGGPQETLTGMTGSSRIGSRQFPEQQQGVKRVCL